MHMRNVTACNHDFPLSFYMRTMFVHLHILIQMITAEIMLMKRRKQI